MKLDYQTMSFGKKDRRITITHLRKPIQYDLAGMASGKLFRHIESGFYDEESGTASVRELELRIAVLQEEIAQETE